MNETVRNDTQPQKGWSTRMKQAQKRFERQEMSFLF